MKMAVLIPWHSDHGPRAAAWDFLRPLWEATGRDLVIGSDPKVHETGQFSVSRAINNAAKHSDADGFVLFGADHVADVSVLQWAEARLDEVPWTPLHDRIAYASEDDTRAVLDGRQTLDGVQWPEQPQRCPGVLAVTADAFRAVGGMDSRFEGWGFEDDALVDRLTRAHEPCGSPSGAVLRELWHPDGHRVLDGPNAQLYRQEYA